MKKKNNYSKMVLFMAHAFEIFISLIVLFAVFLGSIDLLKSLWDVYVVKGGAIGYQQLNDFLGHVILLVIGIELVIMFSLHVPAETLIEVLTFAIAYKIVMIQKSEGMLGVLFGVLALAGVFAIKRFLIKGQKREKLEDSDTNEEEKIA